jgi:transcription-repair coupling factor (superfamily II helicase)
VHFSAQPNIDPMRVIRLIQTQAKTYKMDGQNRLRVIRDMHDAAARFQAVEQLLKELG